MGVHTQRSKGGRSQTDKTKLVKTFKVKHKKAIFPDNVISLLVTSLLRGVKEMVRNNEGRLFPEYNEFHTEMHGSGDRSLFLYGRRDFRLKRDHRTRGHRRTKES